MSGDASWSAQALLKASDCGFDFEVYELESGIGGLWRSQAYPGVAVDTP